MCHRTSRAIVGFQPSCGGRFFSRLIPFDFNWFPHQRIFQHFQHVFNRNNGQAFFDVIGDFRQILLIILRNKHSFDTAAQGRKQFFLEPANCQRVAAQGDFAGHRNVALYRNFSQNRYD